MSRRTIGRIVGALFLLAFVVYGAGGALVDSGAGTPASLADVAGSQTRIAAGALLMLINSVVVVGIGVLAFPVLRTDHEISAHAYLITRVFEAVMLAVGILCLLLLIPLAQAYVDAGAGGGTDLPSLAHVVQEGNQYALHIGMIGLGIGGLLFCRALFRARLVPRPLAVLGIVGYPALAAGEALGVLGYGVGQVHYAPGGLFEVVLGVLLIVKGFPARQDPPGPATALSGPHREGRSMSTEIASEATPAPHHFDGREAMKAIVQDTYGSADVLELRGIDRPGIADDEVLIRVHAAGVDRGVWHLMTGLPYPLRLAGYGLRAPKTPVPGMDVAGVVEAVGREVTRFQPGDEVFGIGKGAFAEYARAREDKLASKPAHLTFEQAAVVAISGLTALHGLRDHARVEPGQTVLIVGASGGVGSYAIQIAKAFGAPVTGVCSTTKVDLVRSLGAGRVIDYTRDDFADGTRRCDVILDIGGNSSLTRLRRALTPRGTLVIVGGEGGGRWLGGTDRLLRAPLLSPFVSQKLGVLLPNENHQDMIVLTELIEAGKIMPAIDRIYPLGEVPKAIRYMEEGNARGKVVITV